MTVETTFLDSIVSALPEAACVLCTDTDQIREMNEQAQKFLGVSVDACPRFANFVGTRLGEFLVFVDEIDTRGQAWTRRIKLNRGDGQVLRCEIRGHKVVTHSNHILLLIIDLDEMDRRAHLTEIAELQRAGLDE